MSIPRASSLDLSSLFPIRVTYTSSGLQGYALHAWSDHSQTWQPCGVLRTGERAWMEIHIDRMEMIAEREQEMAEQQEF